MGGLSSGFFPDIFGRIEFWRVWGQIVEFNVILLPIEPLPYFGTLVIPGVVQDQVYLFILVSGDKLVKKAEKSLGVEPVDEPEVKFGIIADFYRSHYLQGFPCGRGLHHTSDTLQGPMSVNRTRLFEAHFILIHQNAIVLLDFFLISGSSSSSHVA